MNRILSLIGVVLVIGCGSPDGPYETYYDNGQLFQKGTYKNGKPDGPSEVYHENGQLSLKGTYKNGWFDGPFESYHDNGELIVKGSYKDGEPCGEWIMLGETVTQELPY